jgi:hypothetical protein
MKRAWIAFAGLAALGAAALNYQSRLYDWPDGPVYVAETAPLSPAECRGWRSRAQRRHMAGFPGSWEAYEGFSRLQGACHPQDQDRGRAMIEGALAKGAGRFLVVEYVMALRVAGDTARAAAEFPLAAEVMSFRLITYVARVPRAWRPIVVEAKAEIARLETLRNWSELQSRLDYLLSRPALLPSTESWLIFNVTSRMGTIDYPESLYQSYRAWRAGRRLDDRGEDFLHLAAGCGHIAAARLHARLVLSGELPRYEAMSAAETLMWLDSHTGAEGETLAALGALSRAIPRDRDRAIADRNRWIESRCQPRPFVPPRRNRNW